MMYELLLKEMANHLLCEMYHESEKQKGFDIEFHENSMRKANIGWNAVRGITRKILGNKISMQCSIEARRLAKAEFEKGHIYIEALENNAEL